MHEGLHSELYRAQSTMLKVHVYAISLKVHVMSYDAISFHMSHLISSLPAPLHPVYYSTPVQSSSCGVLFLTTWGYPTS